MTDMDAPTNPQPRLATASEQQYSSNEQRIVKDILHSVSSLPFDQIAKNTENLIHNARKQPLKKSLLEKFMNEYHLDSEEGLALLTLAEALLRIPDRQTAESLIADKISQKNWQQKNKQDIAISLGTIGLKFAKSILKPQPNAIEKLLKKISQPSIRHIITQAMHLFAGEFVYSETITGALKRSAPLLTYGYWFSYDMLGEAAINQADADKFYTDYVTAINSLADNDCTANIQHRPSVSIKLSAICPIFSTKNWSIAEPYLITKVTKLAQLAQKAHVQLMIDGEESWRTELTQHVVEKVFVSQQTAHYEGLGLVIQAYLCQSTDYCKWAVRTAKNAKKTLMVRLVKGAYWDTEIKYAQQNGLNDYAVFTRKCHTSLNYLACAKILAHAKDSIYPQFATHNPFTVCAVQHLMGHRRDYELQCLHGMNHAIQDYLLLEMGGSIRCRIYAPVGAKKELLSYLVRRILENGANNSFVHQWAKNDIDLASLVENPYQQTQITQGKKHPNIERPPQLYPDRKNSVGLDLGQLSVLKSISHNIHSWTPPKLGEKIHCSPISATLIVSHFQETTPDQLEKAINEAQSYFPTWKNTEIDSRAQMLELAAENIQNNLIFWTQQLIIEGGKTYDDAISETRETIDFLNYYACQARTNLLPQQLVGPTGETNTLTYHGRGVIGCLSPWNFPLAIFTGQIAAALAAGNCVIAKPAQQTPTISRLLVDVLYEAGIPRKALHLAIGPHGPKIVENKSIDEICLTGSTATAKSIQKNLASQAGPIKQIIAETGGLNVMIADSSALTEQLVTDIVHSAFRSAGQRCSALRVLYLPSSQEDRYLSSLVGAMRLLNIGDPRESQTDVGPVIDKTSLTTIMNHKKWLQDRDAVIYQCPSPTLPGHYFPPLLARLSHLSELKEEVFGPVLHVITYQEGQVDPIIQDINKSKYGLTLGIQSRIESFINHILSQTSVGNNYVNRDMIGATVGVQPFGGHGLSGTGPKAGGPNLLRRLSYEKTVTINTAATGGNIILYNELADS